MFEAAQVFAVESFDLLWHKQKPTLKKLDDCKEGEEEEEALKSLRSVGDAWRVSKVRSGNQANYWNSIGLASYN